MVLLPMKDQGNVDIIENQLRHRCLFMVTRRMEGSNLPSCIKDPSQFPILPLFINYVLD